MPCNIDVPWSEKDNTIYDQKQKLDKLETDLCFLRGFLIKNNLLNQFEDFEKQIYLQDQVQHREEDKLRFLINLSRKEVDINTTITWLCTIKEKDEPWCKEQYSKEREKLNELYEKRKFVKNLKLEEYLSPVYLNEEYLF